MNHKTQGIVAIVASFLVLISAMVDARTTLIISFASLLGLGLLNITEKNTHS